MSRQRAVMLLIGFAHRLAYALLFAISTWVFAWLPTRLATSLYFQLLVQAVNLPVAYVSLFLPYHWRGVDVVFDTVLPHTVETASYLWQHTRMAVPIYLLLFYAAGLARMLSNRWNAGRKSHLLSKSALREDSEPLQPGI